MQKKIATVSGWGVNLRPVTLVGYKSQEDQLVPIIKQHPADKVFGYDASHTR